MGLPTSWVPQIMEGARTGNPPGEQHPFSPPASFPPMIPQHPYPCPGSHHNNGVSRPSMPHAGSLYTDTPLAAPNPPLSADTTNTYWHCHHTNTLTSMGWGRRASMHISICMDFILFLSSYLAYEQGFPYRPRRYFYLKGVLTLSLFQNIASYFLDCSSLQTI